MYSLDNKDWNNQHFRFSLVQTIYLRSLRSCKVQLKKSTNHNWLYKFEKNGSLFSFSGNFFFNANVFLLSDKKNTNMISYGMQPMWEHLQYQRYCKQLRVTISKITSNKCSIGCIPEVFSFSGNGICIPLGDLGPHLTMWFPIKDIYVCFIGNIYRLNCHYLASCSFS